MSTSKKVRSWCFTWNNPPDTFGTLMDKILSGATKYAYQKEVGANGTPHLQGVVMFPNARSFSSVKGLFNDIAHIEPCRSWKDSVKYCTKQDSRVEGPWTKGIEEEKGPIEIKDYFLDYEIKEWQQDIINIVQSEPDLRTIHWYTDYVGGQGKTLLAKHLALKYGALYVQGKANDIKCLLARLYEEKKEIKTVIWDITRSQEGYISYEAIESIKNGIFFSGKYESSQVIINPPHIIIFANFEPEYNKLSQDRWHHVDITDHSKLNPLWNQKESAISIGGQPPSPRPKD